MSIVIPAQIRAGRALVDWSQDDLARAAKVAISSIRNLESQKRSADTGTTAAARRALENAGVEFLSGAADAGPGVRLAANRPNLIRRPTSVLKWGFLPFAVEWQGKEVNVTVDRDVIEDLGGLTGSESDATYIKTFDDSLARILDGVRAAIQDAKDPELKGRLRLEGRYLVGVGR